MLLNHGNLSSRSISGDYCSTEHSGKCCTTPCFYCKEEVGLGTRTSGTMQASGGHCRGPEILSASGRLHLIHRGKCSANSVFCQLSEPTLGPCFLSGPLVFPLFNPGELIPSSADLLPQCSHLGKWEHGRTGTYRNLLRRRFTSGWGWEKGQGEFPWL